MPLRKSALALACLLAIARPVHAARPITVDDLWSMERVSSPVASPDGRRVAFVVTRFDLASNASDADLWVVDIDGSTLPRRLTSGPDSDTAPFWRPDSRAIGFVRAHEGEPSRLHLIELGGGEPQPLARLPVGVRQARYAGDASTIVFEAGTWPDLDAKFDAVKARADQHKADKTQAKISESRALRYWDRWLTDGMVPHLFELDLRSGRVRDLMAGFDRITGFEGFEWDVSADGGEVAFSANSTAAPHRQLNFDLYAVDRKSLKLTHLTPDHPAFDGRPVYAPSGRDLLFTRTKRVDIPSDHNGLARLDRARGEVTELAPNVDASKSAFRWTPDGRRVVFVTDRNGRSELHVASVNGGDATKLVQGGGLDALAVGGDLVAYLRQDFRRPAELHRVHLEAGSQRPLTAFNDAQVATLAYGRSESVTYAGHDGKPVQMWVTYPPGFDATKKHPALLLAHGGPFSAFNEGFSYRWNPQVFAAKGYIVAMPNFHGSTGFGQAFADSILGNHGEKPAADMLAALDWLAARNDVDARRIALAGGSYGGYLAALLPGLTDRFAASIVHAGVFDLTAQFASDSHWERPSSYGNAPWTDPVELDRWSPSRYAPKFATPTLILHGEKDYRVPVTQGINLYGVLTGKGVPARIVIFPDENHWILKPQASRLWHGEFFAWLERFVK